jgi:hypothetical protein
MTSVLLGPIPLQRAVNIRDTKNSGNNTSEIYLIVLCRDMTTSTNTLKQTKRRMLKNSATFMKFRTNTKDASLAGSHWDVKIQSDPNYFL